MDAAGFLGLEPTRDPLRWRLPMAPPICSWMGTLFGGCGLAAGVEALERVTGRPVIWATAQFIAFARPPAVLDLEATILASGHRITQARAILREGDQEVVAVAAALGEREGLPDGSWAERPEVDPPETLAGVPVPEQHRDSFHDRVEIRLARVRSMEQLDGTQGDGRSALWVRIPGLEASAAMLAMVGDYVPLGVSQALGTPVRNTSLDNTLRVVSPGGGGWLLCDVRIHAVERGRGHGLNHIWSDDGRLLATATQSIAVRPRHRSAAEAAKA